LHPISSWCREWICQAPPHPAFFAAHGAGNDAGRSGLLVPHGEAGSSAGLPKQRRWGANLILLEHSRREGLVNKQDIQLLYDYNRWCNAHILGTAAELTDEQFLAPGTFPHAGLRGTLVHALFTEWVWRMRWQATPPDYRLRWKPEEFPTVAALQTRRMQEETLLMEFVAGLTDTQLKSELEYTSTEGGRHTRVLWETMAHLVNHGTQHRTEAAAILTHLGHSPGDIDLIVFLNQRQR
jgi:uncharacterized damage-inducible protein DinB